MILRSKLERLNSQAHFQCVLVWKPTPKIALIWVGELWNCLPIPPNSTPIKRPGKRPKRRNHVAWKIIPMVFSHMSSWLAEAVFLPKVTRESSSFDTTGQSSLDLFLRWFFTVYQGTPPSNHHLREYFLKLFPSILSKFKIKKRPYDRCLFESWNELGTLPVLLFFVALHNRKGPQPSFSRHRLIQIKCQEPIISP